MKYTIELKTYSFDEIRDAEEELETFIYVEAEEKYIDLLLNQYRIMKLCFYKGLITDYEYSLWCFHVCGGEDIYVEGTQPPLNQIEAAELIYDKAVSKLESL